MKKTRLTKDVIPVIVRFLKLRMSWKHIADAIGVKDCTLRKWRATGAKAESGIHYELVIAIEQAQSELIEGYAAVVRNEALNGKVTVTTREFARADGSVAEDTITKTEPPNAALAHKILQQEDPANWADIKHIEIDWRKQVSEQGQDPDEVKKKVGEKVGALIAGTTEDDDEPDDD